MRIGDILDGRYEVRRMWRRVFLVLDLSTGRHFVVRPADGFASPEAVDMLREIVHPSLPRAFGEIETDGRRHILFEYLPGPDLETLVRRSGGVLSPVSAATIILSVAYTVAFLHDCLDRPLVHLDIKPEHVIISGGVPCLIDFSSAVLLSRGDGAARGDSVREATPAYAAPEMSVWRGHLLAWRHAVWCAWRSVACGGPSAGPEGSA
jgi:serine/threonine protein kinase